MEKIAIYGKGGIGKSMIATSLSAWFGMQGRRVLHVGCDPKHDSAVRLLEKRGQIRTVLDVLGSNPNAEATDEILNTGRHGIHCCEAGGPPAGLGCGGRGVARTIEYLDEYGFLQNGNYDVAMFDVLGDVVCGGFAAPLRDGFAEKLVIVLSEEPMSVFAANNIARTVAVYQRNGVVLAGLAANLRGVGVDPAPIYRFAEALGTQVLAVVKRDVRVMEAENNMRTIIEWAPECETAQALAGLGQRILDLDKTLIPPPRPMTDDQFFEFMRGWEVGA